MPGSSASSDAAPRQPQRGAIAVGDCLEHMAAWPENCLDLVFADPPFNIGYQYDRYDDARESDDYLRWCLKWMREIHRLLKPDGTFWLAIGDEYAAELKTLATGGLLGGESAGFHLRSWVVWYYTFGVYSARKFTRSHAHLFQFVVDPKQFTFNVDDAHVRVPSARQLVYADARANPAGRLPDDTWIALPAGAQRTPTHHHHGVTLRPQDLPHGFAAEGDVWYFPRVAGTFKERQGFHGCQMPERLLARIVAASSNPGDVVFDPFTGSGTTLAVAKKLGRDWLGCELSPEYAEAATARLEAAAVGDPLDGADDPLTSAPTTTAGKRRPPTSGS